MQFKVNDGVWVRLIDIEAALSARTLHGDGEIVLEVTDAFLPGERRAAIASPRAALSGPTPKPTCGSTSPALGSVYLGGFGFGDLVRASRAEELTDGAAARGDALFRTGIAPWCAEIF